MQMLGRNLKLCLLLQHIKKIYIISLMDPQRSTQQSLQALDAIQ